MEATIKKLRCLRCGESWWPKGEEPPKNCAKCNSPYWNTLRRKK